MKFSKNFIVFIHMAGYTLVSFGAFCQNTTAPYSIYGIGDIDKQVYNRTNGIGSTGMAIRSENNLINNNPAAIAGLPRSFFVLNAAGIGKTVQYSGEGINASNNRSRDFWIKGITLAVKVNKFWASSVGFKQFSNVNYRFSGDKNVIGTDLTYPAVYEGDGGLNDYFWTNAFSIGKHFSVGIKSSIIAGSINRTETVSNDAHSVATKQQDYFGDPEFEYGAIYSGSLNKHWNVSLGGKYINKTKLNAERTITITDNTTIIVNDQFVKNGIFYLPQTYSGGISVTHNKKITFAADYTYENWSPLNISGDGWRLINSNRFSAGIELSKKVQRWGQTIEKNYFQLGGFINNSYLDVNNTPINEFGITAGTGGVLTNNLLYTISIGGGKRGTTNANLIRENFFQFSVSLTYRDFLASKGRKYE
jgi:hypothetical protein